MNLHPLWAVFVATLIVVLVVRLELPVDPSARKGGLDAVSPPDVGGQRSVSREPSASRVPLSGLAKPDLERNRTDVSPEPVPLSDSRTSSSNPSAGQRSGTVGPVVDADSEAVVNPRRRVLWVGSIGPTLDADVESAAYVRGGFETTGDRGTPMDADASAVGSHRNSGSIAYSAGRSMDADSDFPWLFETRSETVDVGGVFSDAGSVRAPASGAVQDPPP